MKNIVDRGSVEISRDKNHYVASYRGVFLFSEDTMQDCYNELESMSDNDLQSLYDSKIK